MCPAAGGERHGCCRAAVDLATRSSRTYQRFQGAGVTHLREQVSWVAASVDGVRSFVEDVVRRPELSVLAGRVTAAGAWEVLHAPVG